VSEVWVTRGGEGADHYVDITDTFDRKIAALRAHASQTAHMTELEDMLGKWGGAQAKAAGFERGRLAEGYLVLDTR
jgi:LmbE family N-acetylglucosaminyl deacetylase